MRADGAATHPVGRCTRVAFAGLGVSIATVACARDFSVFEPHPGSDASAATQGTTDASGVAEASTGPDGSGPSDTVSSPLPEAAPLADGSTCGADCKIEALSCAGTCAQIEQSCAAACVTGDIAACKQSCLTSQASCASHCVTTCETCTSVAGCIDPTGCAKAAP